MIGSPSIFLDLIPALNEVTSISQQFITASANGDTQSTDATWIACGVRIPNAGGTININGLSHKAGIQTIQMKFCDMTNLSQTEISARLDNQNPYVLEGGSMVDLNCETGKVMTGYQAKLMPWETASTGCNLTLRYNLSCQGTNFDVQTTISGDKTLTECQFICKDNPTCLSLTYDSGLSSDNCNLYSGTCDDLILFERTLYKRQLDGTYQIHELINHSIQNDFCLGDQNTKLYEGYLSSIEECKAACDLVVTNGGECTFIFWNQNNYCCYYSGICDSTSKSTYVKTSTTGCPDNKAITGLKIYCSDLTGGLTATPVEQQLVYDGISSTTQNWQAKVSANANYGICSAQGYFDQSTQDNTGLNNLRFISCQYCFGSWTSLLSELTWELPEDDTIVSKIPIVINYPTSEVTCTLYNVDCLTPYTGSLIFSGTDFTTTSKIKYQNCFFTSPQGCASEIQKEKACVKCVNNGPCNIPDIFQTFTISKKCQVNKNAGAVIDKTGTNGYERQLCKNGYSPSYNCTDQSIYPSNAVKKSIITDHLSMYSIEPASDCDLSRFQLMSCGSDITVPCIPFSDPQIKVLQDNTIQVDRTLEQSYNRLFIKTIAIFTNSGKEYEAVRTEYIQININVCNSNIYPNNQVIPFSEVTAAGFEFPSQTVQIGATLQWFTDINLENPCYQPLCYTAKIINYGSRPNQIMINDNCNSSVASLTPATFQTYKTYSMPKIFKVNYLATGIYKTTNKIGQICIVNQNNNCGVFSDIVLEAGSKDATNIDIPSIFQTSFEFVIDSYLSNNTFSNVMNYLPFTCNTPVCATDGETITTYVLNAFNEYNSPISYNDYYNKIDGNDQYLLQGNGLFLDPPQNFFLINTAYLGTFKYVIYGASKPLPGQTQTHYRSSPDIYVTVVCGTEVVSQSPSVLPVQVFRRDYQKFESRDLTSEIKFQSSKLQCPVTQTDFVDKFQEKAPQVYFSNLDDCNSKVENLGKDCYYNCDQFGKCPQFCGNGLCCEGGQNAYYKNMNGPCQQGKISYDNRFKCMVDENCLHNFSISVNVTTPSTKVVQIIGKSLGFNYSNQFSQSDVKVIVCGFETVSLINKTSPPIIINLLFGQVTHGFDQFVMRMDQLRPYFVLGNLSDSHEDCFVDSFKLYMRRENQSFSELPSNDAFKLNNTGLQLTRQNGVNFAASNNYIALQLDTQRPKIATSIYVSAVTRGFSQSTDMLEIQYETCGEEVVIVTGNDKVETYKFEVDYSKSQSQYQYDLTAIIKENMKSTGDFCSVNDYQLFEFADNEIKVRYQGKAFSIDSQANFYVSKTETLNQTVIIRAFTKGMAFNDFEIRVDIWDCSIANLSYSLQIIKPAPTYNEIEMVGSFLNYHFKSETNNSYVNFFDMSVKDMFVTSDENCQPKTFFITKYEGDLPLKNDALVDYMDLDTNGTFMIYNFKQPLKEIKLMISACNRDNICSPTLKHNLLSVSIEYKNYAPKFVYQNEYIELIFNDKIDYSRNVTLAPYTDPNYEDVKIQLTKFTSSPSFFNPDRKPGPFFIQFHPSNNSFSFSQMQRIDIGLHQAEIRLSDAHGGVNTYIININVKKDDQLKNSNANITVLTIINDDFGSGFINLGENYVRVSKNFVSDLKDGEIGFYKGKFNSNGTCQFFFTELLKAQNVTILNQNVTKVLSINYTSIKASFALPNETIPSLKGWKFIDFQVDQMNIHFDFTNPVHVSASRDKDFIDLSVKDNSIFQSQASRQLIRENFAISSFNVPPQAKSEIYFKQITEITNQAQEGLQFSFAIPFCFMLIQKMNIGRVWSFYYMLQMLTVIIKIKMISIPASSFDYLSKLESIANFNLLKNPVFMQYLQISKQTTLKFMFCTLGEQLCLFIGLLVTLGTTSLIYMKFKDKGGIKRLYSIMREKLVYSSFLRSTLTTYMATSFTIFTMLFSKVDQQPIQEGATSKKVLVDYCKPNELSRRRILIEETTQPSQSDSILKSLIQLIFPYIQLTILVLLPLFSYIVLKKNKKNLLNQDFKLKYHTVYQNLRFNDQALINTSLFCIRRLVLVASICFFDKTYQVQIFMSVHASLLYAVYLVHAMPLQGSLLNQTEIFNEISILYGAYFGFVYSAGWIDDLDTKYDMGTFFVKSTLLVIGFNIFMIFLEIINQLKTNLFKWYASKKWRDYEHKKNQQLLVLCKLYIQNDRINDALHKRQMENQLTNIIEKRSKDLSQFYTKSSNKRQNTKILENTEQIKIDQTEPSSDDIQRRMKFMKMMYSISHLKLISRHINQTTKEIENRKMQIKDKFAQQNFQTNPDPFYDLMMSKVTQNKNLQESTTSKNLQIQNLKRIQNFTLEAKTTADLKYPRLNQEIQRSLNQMKQQKIKIQGQE